MGSMHEIGFYEGSINENTPTNPQSLYGISKNALRQAIEVDTKENDILFQWIRGFYIVGNAESGCSIFSKLAQAASEGKEYFPFTSGENQYDFLDYDEFCYQVAKVTEQDEVNGIINCCSGKPVTLANRVERFIKENGYNIKLQYGAFQIDLMIQRQYGERIKRLEKFWLQNKTIERINNMNSITAIIPVREGSRRLKIKM